MVTAASTGPRSDGQHPRVLRALRRCPSVPWRLGASTARCGGGRRHLARSVRWFGRRAFRRSSVGVVLRWGDQMFQAHRGTPPVTITGPPGEVLLDVFGRQGHARGRFLEGEGEAVEALATTTLSW